MKIAYLFSRYPVPSQTFCDTEMRALEAAGHEIEIYSCSPPTTSFRHGGPKEWPRAPVLYAPPSPVLDAWVAAARRNGTWPAEMVADHEARFGARYDPARRARHALYFADRLRRRGVEHLHVHFANRATHAALFIHALTGTSFSFTAHAQDFLVDLGSDDLLRLMCERAAFVVTVSDWSRRALIERCPDAEPKIQRIYNGLSPEHWPPASAPSKPAESALKIFSVGRLVDFKGFEVLLAACRILQLKGIPFACEIAGDGPRRAVLERKAAAFAEPQARVTLSGLLSQEQVRVRMHDCDVFALACRVDEKGACDVLPTVILEAMAAAKPVVSTRLAAVPEMVEDEVTGFLSPPDDPVSLADSLVRLAADSELRRHLGQAGRERMVSRFSAAEASRQLQNLFVQTRGVRPRTAARGSSKNTIPAYLFCLFDIWPHFDSEAGSAPSAVELAQLRQCQPDICLTALKPGSFPIHTGCSTDPSAVELLQAFEFLPDDFVLETHWRQSESLAHRLETWRNEVGGACGTDAFLLASRRALYLTRSAQSSPGSRQHLHAVGPQSLLCAWLLRRLGTVETISFTLPLREESSTCLAGSTLRKLAPEFVGGWAVAERKLAASLGPNFRGDKFAGNAWFSEVKQWSNAMPHGTSTRSEPLNPLA